MAYEYRCAETFRPSALDQKLPYPVWYLAAVHSQHPSGPALLSTFAQNRSTSSRSPFPDGDSGGVGVPNLRNFL